MSLQLDDFDLDPLPPLSFPSSSHSFFDPSDSSLPPSSHSPAPSHSSDSTPDSLYSHDDPSDDLSLSPRYPHSLPSDPFLSSFTLNKPIEPYYPPYSDDLHLNMTHPSSSYPFDYPYEMEEDEEEEEEYDEEETPTPALAAVPPAEIVTATIADPSYIPNPALANMGKMPSTAPSPSLPAPLPVLPLSHPSSKVAPVESAPPAPSSPAPAPTKRKYTKRAKKWTEGKKSTPPASEPVPSPSPSPPPSSSPPPSVIVDISCSSSSSADAFVSSIMRPPSPLPVIPSQPRARSASVDDDNLSIASSHSNHSSHSAPLPCPTPSPSPSLPLPLPFPVSVAVSSSPSTSPSSSPASSPRSISSSSTPSSFPFPTLAPPNKPGRKRKIKSEPSTDASATPSSPTPSSPSPALSPSPSLSPSSDTDSTPSSDPVIETKRLVRLQRNRASAQLSRERKKQYMDELERQVKELCAMNDKLEGKMKGLMKENQELRGRLGESSVGVVSAVPVKKRMRTGKMEGAGGGGARTTLLMFSLIFSFAIFYTMVGIDLGGDDTRGVGVMVRSSSTTFSPSFAGRVLQSLKECEGTKCSLAIEAPPEGGVGDSSKALVTVDQSADHKALVVKEEGEQEEEKEGQYDPVVQYKAGNGTEGVKGSYLLCPDAISIRPLVDVKVKREREDDQPSTTAKRLRRLGLPSPSSLTPSPPSSPKLSLSPSDQLLLWVPSTSLEAMNGTEGADMVQISCQVSSIDPVYRA